MEQRAEVDDALRCRLLLLLGEAQRKCGDFRRAQATLREAAENARELGLADALALAALAYERATWRTERPRDVEPERLLADALRLAPESAVELRVELMGGLARALLHAGAVTEGRERLDQAIAMARQLGDPGLLATTLNYLFDFPWPAEGTMEMLARATETLEAAIRGGNQEIAAIAHTRRVVCSLELGDMQAVEHDLNHLERGYWHVRQPIFSMILLGLQSMLTLCRGDLATTERLVMRAMTEMPRFDSPQLAYLSVQIFTLRREQGRLKELQAAVSLFVRQTAGAATWRPGLAILYLELDRLDDARAEFESLAAQDFADIPHDGRWTTCITYLAEVCAALGDVTRAAVLYPMLLPYAARVVLQGGGVACCGSGGRYLGLLCATMRRWPEAERHFEDAVALNAKIGARLPLAHTQHDYAMMLLARDQAGDRQRALTLLRQALESARTLGMVALEHRVAARLENLGPARTAVVAVTDDLTTREIEVLGLIAIGRSNADIAMVLSISLNTVATHVRSILGKTGCANRTEAAAYAMRHGLAGAVRQG